MSAVLYPSRVSFVSDWHTACCQPPIHQALEKTMGCSEPALPALPVRRDMGAKDRCRLISANLISAVCLSQLHGPHINWDHANKTGLNLLNYRFLSLTVFLHPAPSFLAQSAGCVIFSFPLISILFECAVRRPRKCLISLPVPLSLLHGAAWKYYFARFSVWNSNGFLLLCEIKCVDTDSRGRYLWETVFIFALNMAVWENPSV